MCTNRENVLIDRLLCDLWCTYIHFLAHLQLHPTGYDKALSQSATGADRKSVIIIALILNLPCSPFCVSVRLEYYIQKCQKSRSRDPAL